MIRRDRRGITGLPMRIMVVMVTLMAALPMVQSAIGDAQASLSRDSLDDTAAGIASAAADAFVHGDGNVRTVEVNVQEGSIVVHEHRLTCSLGDWSEDIVLEDPPVTIGPDGMVIEGSHRLRVECVDGSVVISS